MNRRNSIAATGLFRASRDDGKPTTTRHPGAIPDRLIVTSACGRPAASVCTITASLTLPIYVRNIAVLTKYWSCWTGLNTPAKADALCAISPCALRLCMHRTGSRGGAEARRWGAQRKRAPRATRQTWTRVNVSENCYNPVFASCCRAEALGYTGRSPPARAIPE